MASDVREAIYAEEVQAAGVARPVESEINRLFRLVIKHNGSDLHLKVGLPPMIRIAGTLRPVDLPAVTDEQMHRWVVDEDTGILPSGRHRRILEEDGGVDFAHTVLYQGEESRFRVNLFHQRGHLSLVARRVNTRIPTFKELNLPDAVEKLCQYYQGLIILAGVTGSGKSTTIASMLEYINQRERVHILTIEDPIEYLFKDKKAIINQREVGMDVRDWHVALKHAVREDPDIILVGEMRDRETFEAALQAAETGHLVFGTVHASSAPSTIQRILDLFPPEQHSSIRQNLAFNLRAVICQMLLPTTREWQQKGVTRVPACEIMIQNPTIRKLISEGEDEKLADAIRMFYQEGMLDFTESLRQLVEKEMIDRSTAFEVAPNKEALRMALRGIKVSTPGIL